MNIDRVFQREIKEELDHLGEQIKKSGIKEKELLDAYKRLRKIIN